ncbi:MAG: type II secretion system GspH family protein [Sedimentisphaerales bacterium]|nr:type II secretion system GspH family protein [Sedimentisphaerales bacterium]
MMDKDKGFTLVELLVVISVIALLMGILMPALGKARNVAKRTVCQSNLRQIGVAFRAYLDDNRDIMPLACAFPWDITNKNDPDYKPPITKFLWPLLKEPKVFICPADTVEKYYLRVDNGTSYEYRGMLGGRAISTFAQGGAKERNEHVMRDFVSILQPHGWINYLYADWHVGNLKNQD